MSDNQRLATELTEALQLSQAPVGVSLCDAPPAMPPFDGVVPAGCSFWQLAATRMFYTQTKDHELCSIGVHTHHLARPSTEHPAELQDALQAMSGLDYVRPEEVAALPVVARAVNYVAYGPLAELQTDPDVVLLFTNSRQGLVLTEAVSRVDNGTPTAMGRPACAVIPQVINSGRAAMSLGCCGARAYLDLLSDSIAMWALPGTRLNDYCSQIVTLARANNMLAIFHERRKGDIASGKRPTVRQSLERLSSS
jgi:uncharacterized protein (DUF169 family)